MFVGVILAFGANVLCQDVTDTYILYSGGLVYSDGISWDLLVRANPELSATTATLADTDLSVFVTTMNWVGL